MGLSCLRASFTDNSVRENAYTADVKGRNSVIEEDNYLGGSTMNATISRTVVQHDEEPCESSCSPKNEAAVMLQKAYKSFRTRRKLADCAVIIQNWWEQVDFAKLEHSSVSFFDIDHQETAISRWSRAMTRAAKVGKGLSKNGKARKLALQHWLEAIDPRHRYGHNLHFYYVKWLQSSQSREPFFYWLDIGEGKEVNLEKCPRKKLQQQCIKYLGPMERLAYEVCVENGRLFFKQSGEVVDTLNDSHAKWIFVLSASKVLYIGKKKKGSFQHSSFLAGGATSAAGRLVVDNGVLKAVWPHSGHYRPTPENFQEFVAFLEENNVDLSEVKMDPAEDDDDDKLSTTGNQTIGTHHHSRSNSLEEDFSQYDIKSEDLLEETAASSPAVQEEQKAEDEPTTARLVSQHRPRIKINSSMSRNLTRLQIPRRDDHLSSNVQNYREEETQGKIRCISDSILNRINNSDKEAKSCRWTTGAGPRISCVGDYPSKLHQVHALEQLNLSPRRSTSAGHLLKSPESAPIRRSRCSLKALTPDSMFLHGRSSESSPLTDRTNVAFA